MAESMTILGPLARMTISCSPERASAPTDNVPPRTNASLANRTRFSNIFTARFGIICAGTAHSTTVRPLDVTIGSITNFASFGSTSAPNPPAAPKARRKNFNLSAAAFALSASKSMHRRRISGSCSSANSSRPLFIAPTGLNRSWHRREQRRLAKSISVSDITKNS